MLALFVTLLSAAASETAEHAAEGGFTQFYNEWLNIPGLEVWKFINLAIFIGILIYLLRHPLSQAFKERRNVIRAELIKAEEAKQAALETLRVTDARLAGLEAEKASLLQAAATEAEEEKQRLAEQTGTDIRKMQQQAGSEVDRLQKIAVLRLRRFSAEESIRLAEEKLRARIDQSTDVDLVRSGIASIGGLTQHER